jgi:hypothetical protein
MVSRVLLFTMLKTIHVRGFLRDIPGRKRRKWVKGYSYEKNVKDVKK